MKNKINSRFMAITAISIILTVVATTIVYYRLFQQEVMDDLASYAHIMEETKVFEDDENYDIQNFHPDTKNIRITVVRPDGSVVYDTQADVSEMDNHSNRPEIKEAFREGEGRTVRTSTTIKKSNFYYAVRMDNGNVLRVAKETGSIWSVYCSVFPLILLICGVLFWVCYLVGHYLTKSLISPIEQMAGDLNHLEQVSTYKELMPFIDLIRTQHEDILRSAKMRQEFTANVSHELKTPLTSISGYSELIENGMATEKDVTRFAAEIHRNAKRLLSLINDIIKLSELDSASEHQISMERVDLYDIAQSCVNMVEPSAAKHQITLHLSGKSTVITANRDMMEELVYNLCDNAIRYNQEGGNVWVEVGEALTVRDDGIGISEENQQRIFERFFRVDKSRSKKTGGTGLGLAIVKHIVDLHEAQLTLQSQVGEGTTISVAFHKL